MRFLGDASNITTGYFVPALRVKAGKEEDMTQDENKATSVDDQETLDWRAEYTYAVGLQAFIYGFPTCTWRSSVTCGRRSRATPS